MGGARGKIDDEVQVTFNFIPSTWGRRMTHPFKQNAFLTAEDLANFLLHIGPALLHQHLPPLYYAHFLALRSICLRLTAFEMPKASVAPGGSLRTDIEAWVQEYERLYYNHSPAYLPNMTSPIHLLLHACDYVRWLGPLHLSWSFVMECYCQVAGWLVRSILFPYANMANQIVHCLQLIAVAAHYPESFDLTLTQNWDVTGLLACYLALPSLSSLQDICQWLQLWMTEGHDWVHKMQPPGSSIWRRDSSFCHWRASPALNRPLQTYYRQVRYFLSFVIDKKVQSPSPFFILSH
ncbi:hypothetical protein JCM5296_005483 [Sporobolomyces johnsonii]